MIKALFLDMDETLCDTTGANKQAKMLLVEYLESNYSELPSYDKYVDGYVDGIYRNWTESQKLRYEHIISANGEEHFRNQLIIDLFELQSVSAPSMEQAQNIQNKFDRDRLAHFRFYQGIPEFLAEAKEKFTLVVITNGPEHSQLPKIDTVNLKEHVDHIIVGGQEPAQKPAQSIFEKALKLAKCQAEEAVHIGDSLAADIAGANSLGIQSIWIQHQQAFDDTLNARPDHIVSHPKEIPSLVQELYVCV